MSGRGKTQKSSQTGHKFDIARYLLLISYLFENFHNRLAARNTGKRIESWKNSFTEHEIF